MAKSNIKDGFTLRKVNLRLYAEDVEAINIAFPDIGYNAVIRELVHEYVMDLRARTESKAGKERS